MAIVMKTVCDIPDQDEQHDASGNVTITIGGSLVPADEAGPYVLDLCSVDYEQQVKPLLALLTERGRENNAAIKADGLGCPTCGKSFNTRNRYLKHLRSHDAAPAKPKAPAQPATPAEPKAAEAAEAQPKPSNAADALACRHPGCNRKYTGTHAPQARASHERQAHGKTLSGK